MSKHHLVEDLSTSLADEPRIAILELYSGRIDSDSFVRFVHLGTHGVDERLNMAAVRGVEAGARSVANSTRSNCNVSH